MKKWAFQVRPKANRVWSFPINSPRSEGHLIHQISVTFISKSVKHLPHFSSLKDIKLGPITQLKWNMRFWLRFFQCSSALWKSRRKLQTLWVHRWNIWKPPSPSLPYHFTHFLIHLRQMSMFLKCHSQMHSSGGCFRFTNPFTKEVLQVYFMSFSAFPANFSLSESIRVNLSQAIHPDVCLWRRHGHSQSQCQSFQKLNYPSWDV